MLSPIEGFIGSIVSDTYRKVCTEANFVVVGGMVSLLITKRIGEIVIKFLTEG
jgi:hypothetical protein